jgi:hypothetical protein
LPRIPQAPDHLVLQSIDSQRLFGKSIGWIDAHLLTASLLSSARRSTFDHRLRKLV